MSSTLLGLPREIRELIYFDALAHAAAMILALPLAAPKINPHGVAALAKDVYFLSDFVDTLENSFLLKDTLEELKQTTQLMQLENPDEFYDIGFRNRKFGRVDATNGPVLLEKYDMNLSLYAYIYMLDDDGILLTVGLSGSRIRYKVQRSRREVWRTSRRGLDEVRAPFTGRFSLGMTVCVPR
jgi:hypothetical protein